MGFVFFVALVLSRGPFSKPGARRWSRISRLAMKWVPFAFGFAAIAFAIRAVQHDHAVLSWLAAIGFAVIVVLWIVRGGPKT